MSGMGQVDAYVVEPNSEPPFLPNDQVPFRLKRRALRLHHTVRPRRCSPVGNQVWVILWRRMDFVAVKGLHAEFFDGSALVIRTRRQRENPLHRQIPGHLHADIQGIGVVVGISVFT